MRLYVNIDHVATLREARKTDEPDPVRAADAAERGGADGITVHLREDRRHIQDADVRALKQSVRTVLNLELGARQGPRPRGARGPRADVSERPAGRPYPRDRGAEYRALDREQLGVLGTGRGGAADAEVGG